MDAQIESNEDYTTLRRVQIKSRGSKRDQLNQILQQANQFCEQLEELSILNSEGILGIPYSTLSDKFLQFCRLSSLPVQERQPWISTLTHTLQDTFSKDLCHSNWKHPVTRKRIKHWGLKFKGELNPSLYLYNPSLKPIENGDNLPHGASTSMDIDVSTLSFNSSLTVEDVQESGSMEVELCNTDGQKDFVELEEEVQGQISKGVLTNEPTLIHTNVPPLNSELEHSSTETTKVLITTPSVSWHTNPFTRTKANTPTPLLHALVMKKSHYIARLCGHSYLRTFESGTKTVQTRNIDSQLLTPDTAVHKAPKVAKQVSFHTSVTDHPLRHIPPLGSQEMREYARSNLRNAPERIQNLLHVLPLSQTGGIDMTQVKPLYVTDEYKQSLEDKGFVTIPNIINLQLIEEAKRYISLKMRSEHIDSQAYLIYSGPQHTVGLVMKHGWTKIDYAGPIQQMFAAIPGVYRVAVELYGDDRLVVNFYEYKVCHPRYYRPGELLEFLHADLNFKELLNLIEAGVPATQLCYQFIIPLTPMKPDGATVYFASGFHKHWRAATYRALQADHWSRHGWHTCNPLHQFLPHDAEVLIMDRMEPVSANVGDIVVFSPFLPHGPNPNRYDSLQMAVYNFYGRVTSEQDIDNPSLAKSYLPNSIHEVAHAVQTGQVPTYSAHPWCQNELSKPSRNFFSLLPYQPFPLSNLARSLFGLQAWKSFEESADAQQLFSNCKDPESQKQSIFEMQQPLLHQISQLNDQIEEKLLPHLVHQFSSDCEYCIRLQNASLSQWWHSTTALEHLDKGCSCDRCKAVAQQGWKSFRNTKGCTCSMCTE